MIGFIGTLDLLNFARPCKHKNNHPADPAKHRRKHDAELSEIPA